MSVKIIQERLDSYKPKSLQDEEMALREITQEVALYALYNTNFYNLAAFHGGTCLRLFYSLNRFSEDLDFVLKSIRMIRRELHAGIALIGFCGAPFTLATYMIEGGKPNPFANIKALMYKDPEAFTLLSEKLKDMVRIYLREMVNSGADAIQLFDTWAGTLHSSEFKSNVLPFVKEIFEDLKDLNVPMTYFVHNGSHLLHEIKETGCSVVSLDWRCSIPEARMIFGNEMALQGNLDPTVLLGDEKTIRKKVREILDEAAGNGGFIFNLGHGILPVTPVSSVEIMLDEIRGAH